MARYITLPNGKGFEVREGETPQQAFDAAMEQYPEAFGFPGAPKDTQDKSGFKAALSASTSNLQGGLHLLAGKMGFKDTAKAEADAKVRFDEAAARHTPTKEGWIDAPFQNFKETLGGSIPNMVAPAVGGALAVAAGPALGVGALTAGAVGSFAGSYPQFAASHMRRDMDENKRSLEETSGTKAALTAIAPAALDSIALRFIPGLRGLLGAAGKEVTEAGAAAIAKQTVKQVALDYAKHTTQGMTVEGLTEATQAALERAHAGLNLTDPEARKEYFENFIGGAVLAGVLGPGGRYVERGQQVAKGKQLEQERLKKEQDAANADKLRQEAGAAQAAQQQAAANEQATAQAGGAGPMRTPSLFGVEEDGNIRPPQDAPPEAPQSPVALAQQLRGIAALQAQTVEQKREAMAAAQTPQESLQIAEQFKAREAELAAAEADAKAQEAAQVQQAAEQQGAIKQLASLGKQWQQAKDKGETETAAKLATKLVTLEQKTGWTTAEAQLAAQEADASKRQLPKIGTLTRGGVSEGSLVPETSGMGPGWERQLPGIRQLPGPMPIAQQEDRRAPAPTAQPLANDESAQGDMFVPYSGTQAPRTVTQLNPAAQQDMFGKEDASGSRQRPVASPQEASSAPRLNEQIKTLALYDATRTDRPGSSAEDKENVILELEGMLHDVARGRFDTGRFARSTMGSRLDTPTLMTINEQLRSDPKATLQELLDHANGKIETQGRDAERAERAWDAMRDPAAQQDMFGKEDASVSRQKQEHFPANDLDSFLSWQNAQDDTRAYQSFMNLSPEAQAAWKKAQGEQGGKWFKEMNNAQRALLAGSTQNVQKRQGLDRAAELRAAREWETMRDPNTSIPWDALPARYQEAWSEAVQKKENTGQYQERIIARVKSDPRAAPALKNTSTRSAEEREWMGRTSIGAPSFHSLPPELKKTWAAATAADRATETLARELIARIKPAKAAAPLDKMLGAATANKLEADDAALVERIREKQPALEKDKNAVADINAWLYRTLMAGPNPEGAREVSALLERYETRGQEDVTGDMFPDEETQGAISDTPEAFQERLANDPEIDKKRQQLHEAKVAPALAKLRERRANVVKTIEQLNTETEAQRKALVDDEGQPIQQDIAPVDETKVKRQPDVEIVDDLRRVKSTSAPEQATPVDQEEGAERSAEQIQQMQRDASNEHTMALLSAANNGVLLPASKNGPPRMGYLTRELASIDAQINEIGVVPPSAAAVKKQVTEAQGAAAQQQKKAAQPAGELNVKRKALERVKTSGEKVATLESQLKAEREAHKQSVLDDIAGDTVGLHALAEDVAANQATVLQGVEKELAALSNAVSRVQSQQALAREYAAVGKEQATKQMAALSEGLKKAYTARDKVMQLSMTLAANRLRGDTDLHKAQIDLQEAMTGMRNELASLLKTGVYSTPETGSVSQALEREYGAAYAELTRAPKQEYYAPARQQNEAWESEGGRTREEVLSTLDALIDKMKVAESNRSEAANRLAALQKLEQSFRAKLDTLYEQFVAAGGVNDSPRSAHIFDELNKARDTARDTAARIGDTKAFEERIKWLTKTLSAAKDTTQQLRDTATEAKAGLVARQRRADTTEQAARNAGAKTFRQWLKDAFQERWDAVQRARKEARVEEFAPAPNTKNKISAALVSHLSEAEKETLKLAHTLYEPDTDYDFAAYGTENFDDGALLDSVDLQKYIRSLQDKGKMRAISPMRRAELEQALEEKLQTALKGIHKRMEQNQTKRNELKAKADAAWEALTEAENREGADAWMTEKEAAKVAASPAARPAVEALALARRERELPRMREDAKNRENAFLSAERNTAPKAKVDALIEETDTAAADRSAAKAARDEASEDEVNRIAKGQTKKRRNAPAMYVRELPSGAPTTDDPTQQARTPKLIQRVKDSTSPPPNTTIKSKEMTTLAAFQLAARKRIEEGTAGAVEAAKETADTLIKQGLLDTVAAQDAQTNADVAAIDSMAATPRRFAEGWDDADNSVMSSKLNYDHASRGTRPLSDAATTAVAKGDLLGAIRELAANAKDPFIREAAAKLLPFLANTRIQVSNEVRTRGKLVDANYDPKTDTITMSRGFMTEETLLHEAAHAATISTIDADPKTLTFEQREALKELRELFAKVQKDVEFADEYGAQKAVEGESTDKSNFKEFVSEVLSNKSLRDKLDNKVGYDNGPSVLRSIWKGIAKLLGFFGIKVNTAPAGSAEQTSEQIYKLFRPSEKLQTADTVSSILRGVFPGRGARYSDTVSKEVQDITNASIGRQATLGDKLTAINSGLAWRTAIADRWAPIEALVKRGVAKGVIKEVQALQLRLHMRNHEQAGQYVSVAATQGVPQLRDQDGLLYGDPKSQAKNGKGTYAMASAPGANIKQIAEALTKANVGNEEATEMLFTQWMAVQRGKLVGFDKLNYTRELTPAQIKAIDDTVANDEATKKAFDEARKIYKQYNTDLMNLAVQAGVISKETAAYYLKGDYVPFYRIKGDAVLMDLGTSKPITIGNVIDQPHLKELVGGNDKLLPFFDGAMQNTSMIIRTALRNMQTKDTTAMLRDMGYAVIHKAEGGKSGPPGAIRFKHEGNEFWAELDKDVFAKDGIPAEVVLQGMQGIKTAVPGLVKAMSGPANFLRKTVTRMPLYAMRQMVRDPLHAWLTTGASFNPVLSSFKELAKVMKGESETDMVLKRAGVISSNVFTGDEQDTARILRDISQSKTPLNQALAKLDEFAMAADATTRAVLYDSFRAKGMGHHEALLNTLESMNFSRRGTSASLHWMGAMVPFFNAQIQGADAVYRAFKGDTTFQQKMDARNILLKRGALIAASTMAYAMLMQDDEAYKNATPEERAMNWFLRVPGVDEPVRVPIPFELGLIFKSIPEAAMNVAFGDTKLEAGLKAVGKQLWMSTPLSLPTAINPAVELAANYSFFTDQPIESGRERTLTSDQRYRPGTTEAAKLLGSLGVLSPVQVEHLVRGYTGGVGLTLMAAADLVLRPLTGSDEVEKADRKNSELAVLGPLFQPNTGRGIINEVYKDVERFQQAHQTYKKLLEEGNRAEAAAFASRFSREIALASTGGAFRQQMGELATLKRNIAASRELSGEQKREQIDRLKQVEIQYAQRIKQLAMADD